MFITNYEDTGLIQVENYLSAKSLINGRTFLSEHEKELIKQLLEPFNISFALEGINRIQSTLLCELNLSYIQQSQRYVTMEGNFLLPKADSDEEVYLNQISKLLKKSQDLYAKMSVVNKESNGRPKIEDYKHGIPIEDARYILPLATKTNMIVSCNASKLIEIFELFNSKDFYFLFTDLFLELKSLLPQNIASALSICFKTETSFNINDFFERYFKLTTANNPVVLLNDFENTYERVALGAWISSQSDTPKQIKANYGDSFLEKCKGIINRVIGYGHKAIIEHSRNTFVGEMSMVTYHQFIRHRLTVKKREPLINLINKSHNFIIPETIRNSIFFQEYNDLIKEFVLLRKSLPVKFQYYLILNCETLKVIYSSNARIDCENMSERICLTAQWEIRKLYTEEFDILYNKYPDIYKYALPTCVNGTCKEGKMTCGKAQLMQKKYKIKE